MLPIPSFRFWPKIFQGDPRTASTAAKMDTHLTAWGKDTLGLRRLIRPDECPSIFLGVFGYMLNAGILPLDSDQVKRRKIRDAIATHKIRGSWANDAKKRIDNITGLNAVIVTQTGLDDWILCGDGTEPPAFYWAALGVDGIDYGLGISLIGEGTEIEVAGNIYINLHYGITTPVLTAAQIAQIVQELSTDVAAAYYIIYLGYVDGAGMFQIYAGGIIS